MDINLKHCNSTGPCGTVQRLFGLVDSKQNHIRTVEHISMQVRQEELHNFVKSFQKEHFYLLDVNPVRPDVKS